jgi:hypothetical protein
LAVLGIFVVSSDWWSDPVSARARIGQIVALRKRNLSIYEISAELKAQGAPLSATAVHGAAREGFAKASPLLQRAITEPEVTVRFHRRAHLPIALASDLFNESVVVPWWKELTLRFVE